VAYSIARGMPVRGAVRRPASAQSPRRRPGRPRSLVGAIAAYILIGSFLGVLGWELTETAAEARRLDSFERPDIAVEPPPEPPPPFIHEPLADVLARQAPATGTASLYVKHLDTGAEAEVNGQRIFAAASLYKLPVLTEVIRQTRLRRLSFDQQMMVRREHWVPGSGVLQARVGQSLPVRELVRLLIVESDNIAAIMLIELLGIDNINLTLQSMGLHSTKLLDHRSTNAHNGLGPYVTSASDVGLLLDTIASGRLVDPTGSEEALRLLERKQGAGWLADGLPWWVKVAHKWGEVPGARHDAGVIFTPRNQYVIVVMTEGLAANGSAGYIRDVSKAVFNHFEGNR